MENPVEFYRALNRSSSGYRDAWKEYRKDVTGFALSAFKKAGNTIVIGAGNMNDLEFGDIKRESSFITLADIDCEPFSNLAADKLATAYIDFGCLDEIALVTNYKEAIKLLEKTVPHIKSSIGEKKFDNILISPFYTQLVLPWLFVKFPDQGPDSLLIESGLAMAGEIIKKSNEYIKSLAAPGCMLCIWTDILEYRYDDLALSDISANINDLEWMTAFIHQYIESYGHGTGSYGHMEMESFLKNTKSKWLIWPFSNSRKMIVKITTGTID